MKLSGDKPHQSPRSSDPSPGLERAEITSRKVVSLSERLDSADDSLTAWSERYLDLAVRGARSSEVTGKITRHLERFVAWTTSGLGHDRLSAVTSREVTAWRDHLAAAGTEAAALLLSAASIAARRPDGRLSPRSNNTIVGEIGRLHDAQTADPRRELGVVSQKMAHRAFVRKLVGRNDPTRDAHSISPNISLI
ncbi:hypothetical protein [Nonomuraea sp. NPDC049695]|uniref:hypothetical protein n=1 Tax=Nonomuraea sp. NPDC049695 TaxID=3154734 RepID=UPI003442688D